MSVSVSDPELPVDELCHRTVIMDIEALSVLNVAFNVRLSRFVTESSRYQLEVQVTSTTHMVIVTR